MDYKRCTAFKQSCKTPFPADKWQFLRKIHRKDHKNKNSEKPWVKSQQDSHCSYTTPIQKNITYKKSSHTDALFFLSSFDIMCALNFIFVHTAMYGSTSGIEGLILTVLAILIILIFGGAIYAFFLAIRLFIFSGWDEEKIKQAWTSIRFMILGILMTLAFLFLFPLLFKSMKVPGYQAYTAQNIFRQASAVIKLVLSFGKDATIIYRTNSSTSSDTTPLPTPANPSQIEL